jgi:hypothetical protein
MAISVAFAVGVDLTVADWHRSHDFSVVIPAFVGAVTGGLSAVIIGAPSAALIAYVRRRIEWGDFDSIDKVGTSVSAWLGVLGAVAALTVPPSYKASFVFLIAVAALAMCAGMVATLLTFRQGRRLAAGRDVVWLITPGVPAQELPVFCARSGKTSAWRSVVQRSDAGSAVEAFRSPSDGSAIARIAADPRDVDRVLRARAVVCGAAAIVLGMLYVAMQLELE